MTPAQSQRLQEGGRIDRSRPLAFRFDGRELQGYEGDTLASALLANGVRLVGRSFKLHRPRGIVGCGGEEPNAVVQIGSGATALPDRVATQVQLFEGLEAHSVRGWPGLRWDAGATLGAFSRVLSTGFYYKTFISPVISWRLAEPLVRRSAGWGSAPDGPDPDRYEHRNAHCDVLVAGGGPAGLMAALAAADAGARVILADEQNEFGGRLLSMTRDIEGQAAADWVRAAVESLGAHDRVTLLSSSTVFGYHDHNFLTIAERRGNATAAGVRQRLWRVRARQVVLTQGAIERPLVFANNDRPGVMLASAVSTYAVRYAVRPGQHAVIFTNNDSAYQAAIDLHRAGAEVAAVVDCRPGAAGVRGEVEALGIPVIAGHVVTNVLGRGAVRGVRVARWDGEAERVESNMTIDCDLLAVSGGWSPAVHLHSQSGGRIDWNEESGCFVPGKPAQACLSAGSGNGAWMLQDCFRQGADAGREAAARCGLTVPETAVPRAPEPAGNPLLPVWRVPAEEDPDRCPKQFLDFQNDTSVADIRQAVREGYRHVEHVKRYTALGFGTDQGKLGNVNGMAVLAACLGKPIPEVGTTTFRPAYTPVRFGVCAGESVGELFDPVRKTALHEWHEARGAVFEPVGQWHRPRYYPRGDESMAAAVDRECLAVRDAVGLMDGSTLGKIDVRGADAATFLDRVYTHDVSRMEKGRCAYAVLLGEDGMVMDDGVVSRLGEQHFYLTTTTGGAARVLAWLESWLQTEWTDLDVRLTSLTDHYSTLVLAGPACRQVLQDLGCSADLDGASFPFMSVRPAELGGIPIQLFRVSFSGELAYEINVESSCALAVWERLMAAGEGHGITPYGTEAMHVLRAEKGFFIVGQDTDGSVTPVDLKLGWLLSRHKDFLGKRSLSRPDALRQDRKQWVGLVPVDERTVVPEGSQLVQDPNAAKPVPTCGHVTSSYHSSCLGHPIALGLVAGGHARTGETVFAPLEKGQAVELRIVSPAFLDPRGERQNA
ncbi:MAG: sarcosine oxidase subunit alpha family protein [Lysobacterales bacterium]|jgi:sarcosine oxidase subunit alpha